jgi:hypothetical protein
MTWGGLTGLCRRFNHPWQCELGLLFIMHFQMTFSQAMVQGELSYVQEELLCEFLARGLVCLWWYLLFVRACFCLGCVEPLPLSKGPRLSLFK